MRDELAVIESDLYEIFMPRPYGLERHPMNYNDEYLRAKAKDVLEKDPNEYTEALRYYTAALRVNPFDAKNYASCALISIFNNDVDAASTCLIEDLNHRIFQKLEEINTSQFQKRPGSRKSIFVEEEKSYLQPLPQTRYKLSQWKVATVGLNYHIQVERMHYSVPYDYVRERVDIRLSAGLIEVYFKEVRIASHKRLKGEIGQYSTNKDHMPDNHRLYLDHNPKNNKLWAETIGRSMTEFVSYILETNVEKKALNILATLRNLFKKYTNKEMETAAQTLLKVSTSPTISVIKSILERNKKRDKNKNNSTDNSPINDENYGFVRGAKYFGGDDL